MNLHPLPPQAYTKDVLVKAYEWLQTQSDSIKQIATSPDILVSLYMKAKLQGEDSLHRGSIRNFKNDLKNIASMMGDWDKAQSHEPKLDEKEVLFPVTEVSSPSSLRSTNQPASKVTSQQSDSIPVEQPAAKREGSPLKTLLGQELYQELVVIQNNLHLSSEGEALKAMASLGVQSIKRLMNK